MDEAVRWYLDRIVSVLEDDTPRLATFDFDAAAAGYHRRQVSEVVAGLTVACGRMASAARSISDAQMSRAGVGSDGSPRTVAHLLARAEHEMVHHELDLRRALGDQAPSAEF